MTILERFQEGALTNHLLVVFQALKLVHDTVCLGLARFKLSLHVFYLLSQLRRFLAQQSYFLVFQSKLAVFLSTYSRQLAFQVFLLVNVNSICLIKSMLGLF